MDASVVTFVIVLIIFAAIFVAVVHAANQQVRRRQGFELQAMRTDPKLAEQMLAQDEADARRKADLAKTAVEAAAVTSVIGSITRASTGGTVVGAGTQGSVVGAADY